MSKPKTGVAVWIVGVMFGLLAAVIHLLLPEQGLTFLWVMLSTMILGVWKRDAPWRWMILVVTWVPLADIIHKVVRPQQVSRAALWGAGLLILASVPGAYGGSYGRLMIDNVFGKKSD